MNCWENKKKPPCPAATEQCGNKNIIVNQFSLANYYEIFKEAAKPFAGVPVNPLS